MTLPLLTRLYRRGTDEALKEYGLSKMAALPLDVLAQADGGLRHGALAELVNIEGPALLRFVDRFVAAGHVERVDAEKDHPSKFILLPVSGRAFHEQLRARLAEARSILLKAVNDRELGVAVKLLETVLQNTLKGRDRRTQEMPLRARAES